MNRLFLIFAVCMTVSAFSVHANPLISSQPDSGQQSGKPSKEVNPVRITGGSQNLFQAQGDLRSKLADIFTQLSDTTENSLQPHLQLVVLILLISFLYGILHAAGPGHRKTIVFSLYLTRQAPVWEPALVALILAFLHGGAAIIIMLLFKGIAGSVTANTGNLTVLMEGFSYVILIAATAFLIIHESISYAAAVRNDGGKTAAGRSTVQLLPFIVSGIYPCPGAILIMVLCFTMHVLRFGILSVMAMSLGMSIPVMAAAYLAWSGRTGLFRILKDNEKAAAKTAFIIEICGYTLLLVFSLYISWPFLASLV